MERTEKNGSGSTIDQTTTMMLASFSLLMTLKCFPTHDHCSVFVVTLRFILHLFGSVYCWLFEQRRRYTRSIGVDLAEDNDSTNLSGKSKESSGSMSSRTLLPKKGTTIISYITPNRRQTVKRERMQFLVLF